ncbi:hypothetical protein BD779DRAFT_1673612 [Infundibulicybe gibba]|nr:hypothetical protein BD779DRAFT_1673612 [Infundibulicybe gibba]
MMMTSALAALALFTLPHVFGAVMIGNFGSSYDPPTLSVSANDTVVFVFAEATFENPCLPLEGGFSSGLAGPTNTSGPYSWNLKVTDDTQPLWYFCGATVPVFHCTDGMVGAINPPSPAMYNSFLSAAKSVSTMPVSTPTLALQGQGAFATAPIAQPTSEPSKSNHDAAIIGGAVGGAIGIILIALLIFLVFYYRRRARKNKEKFSAGVKPSAPPQDVYYTPGHIGASPSPPMTATSVDPSYPEYGILLYNTPSRAPGRPARESPITQRRGKRARRNRIFYNLKSINIWRTSEASKLRP